MKSTLKLSILVLALTLTLSITPTLASNNALQNKVHKGKVIESMDSGGYTYMHFEENGKKLWVATRLLKVSVGDLIEFGHAAPMKKFFSKTLNRTFEDILFVNRVKVNGKLTGVGEVDMSKLPKGHVPIPRKPAGHPKTSGKVKKDVTVEPGSIQKAKDGYTVAQCFTEKDKLSGNVITIRGKVVKFNSQIMGKNWIHLQDGTGKPGSDDLTITTQDSANVGDTILVKGKIVYNKNFGSGYKYKVIMEEARIIK